MHRITSRPRRPLHWTAALLAFGLLAWAGNAQAHGGLHVSRGDGLCPAGQAPISPVEARADLAATCNSLGTWYIARLAGGGSMDGPGYGCKVRSYDDRALGHTLCAPISARPVPAVYRPAPDVYRPTPRPTYRPAHRDPLRSGQRIALRGAHGRFLVADPNGRLSAGRVLRGAWESFTLLADGAVRSGESIRLRTAHGQFVSTNRRGDAVAQRGRKGRKASWSIESADGQRRLSCGDRVNLRSRDGRYLSAEPDGRANAAQLRPASWETFTVICL